MNIVLFSGSLRKDSFNRKLIALAAAEVAKAGHHADVVDLKGLSLPVYDGDLEGNGLPAGVTELGAKIASADALILSSPEYNGGIAGSLKNTIDWVSRLRPAPLSGKQLLLLAASMGPMAGVRGLWHTRVPLEALGMHVFPSMVGLGSAHEAFDGNGALKDAATRDRLESTIKQFLQFAARK